MRLKLLVSLLLLPMLPFCSQTFDSKKMDVFLDVIESNDKGMGSISVFKNGKEIYQKPYGFSNLKHQSENNKKTKFRIGSISKTFTAAIIMQMVDEGKLTLNTKLSKFFPKIPNAKIITIENLLQHRSGLLNFTRIDNFDTWRDKPHTREELLEKIKKQKNIFQPNEKTEYSNTNYILLSIISEKIDGIDFKSILEKRIIKKCNLKNTSFGSLIKETANEAQSYNNLSGKWIADKETHYSIPLGAGSIASTPTDLNNFYYHLFEKSLVSKSSLQKMTTIINGIGMGLFQFPYHNYVVYGHEGSIDAFQSVVIFFPKEKISIALSTNGNIYPISKILVNAAGLYFEKEFSIPEFKKAIEVKSKDLDAYLGIYSGTEFPLKVSVTKKNNELVIKAEGQPEFVVEAYEPHKFRFEQAEIYFTFILKDKKMVVNQGGKDYSLFKKN
ncbi:serine hydrolase domain-containing protein [Polaribacter uvawellassae]|uniref:serine hydrolase domain-containing protein n=1 Tax=Polaribacter uvawellassae TaxID=3133495 RepID=UPI00321AA565